jgi:hypothetical protein
LNLQAGFDRVKKETAVGKAGTEFLGGGSSGVDRSRTAPAPNSGSGTDLTDDQRSALQQLENNPDISPVRKGSYRQDKSMVRTNLIVLGHTFC